MMEKENEIMVRFSFNESCMINSLLGRPDKRAFINKLKGLLKDEEMDKEIRDSVESLIEKFEKLSENQVRKIYEDRVAGNITILPQYTIK